jgi:hypothetical protein
MTQRIPEICDFDCPFADFPPPETAGICRTMSAVWCKKLRELVNKNTPCEWQRRGRPTQRTRSATRGRRRSR